MIEEDIDLVAGDFDGASWRRKMGRQQQYDSTLAEALKNARLPVPPDPIPLVLAVFPHKWTDECGFVPNSKRVADS